MRALTARTYAAIKGTPVFPVVLVTIDHPTAMLYLWSGTGPLVYGGNTYSGVGLFAGVEGVTSDSNIRIWEVQLFLSGVPADALDAIETSLKNKACTIDIAFMDKERNVLPDLIRMAEPTLDAPIVAVDEGGLHTLVLNGQLGLWQLERILAVSWTTEQQQDVYSTDTGFDMIPELADKEVTWTLT